MEFLPRMKDKFYTIDGNDVRLINYDIHEKFQTVRFMFSHRNYDIKFDDIPVEMMKWIPVSDGKFMDTYNHLNAQLDLTPSELGIVAVKNEVARVEQQLPANPSIALLEELATKILDDVANDINDMAYILDKVREAIISVKNNATYIPQAKMIQGLLKTMIDGKKSVNDKYNMIQRTLASMRALEAKNKPKDTQSKQDSNPKGSSN